jgi:hypothetical protein
MIEHALWGVKTVAMFDAWSIEHLLSGMSIGYVIRRSTRSALPPAMKTPDQMRTRLRFDLIAVGFAAYSWEAIEHYLETGLAGAGVAFWFQGVEVWSNRLVSDPLMLVLGYWIVSRRPRLVWPARWASLAWLAAHIVLFPHSMYLHEMTIP